MWKLIFTIGFMTIQLFVGFSDCDIGYFWHVTDFHYDFTYDDRRISCNLPNKSATLGLYGDFWCDSPWSLVNSSVQAMGQLHKGAVDFVLWTGDNPPHGDNSELNYTIKDGINNDTTSILKTLFQGIPVYAALGNHDNHPTSQFPANNTQLYNDSLARWSSWINDSSQDIHFRKGGYYTVKTAYGLRIISLNTNLYYTSNKAAGSDSDPGEQLAWLQSVLNASLYTHEKVLITAHLPPGVHTPRGLMWMSDAYHKPLIALLKQYAEIVVGMHFGHDHQDGFKILKNDNGGADLPIYIAPSVTPWRYKLPEGVTGPSHNPGVRLVKYDRETGAQLDIEQYYLDLEKANKDGVANWELEYTASAAYDMGDISARQLLKLSESMKIITGDAFKKYWKFYSVSPKDLLECNATCHASIVCGLTEFSMAEYNDCTAKIVSACSGLTSWFLVIILTSFASFMV